MGTALPKQFLPLADRPILIRTLEAFWRFQDTLPIALVLPTSDFDLWEGLASTWLSPSHQAQLLLCEGGNSRCHSVYNWFAEAVSAHRKAFYLLGSYTRRG